MRIRVTFSKTGPMIYIGNLDMYTLWERAARRAGLPLAYSQGFHPQPKLHFGSPLPLGFSSRCELLDMKVNEDVDLARLPDRLDAALPAGVRVLAVEEVREDAPALQTVVEAAEYEVRIHNGPPAEELERRTRVLLEAATLPRERRKKQYDLRPLIQRLEVFPGDETETAKLRMSLTATEGATGRPDEVLEALNVDREDARIERTRLLLRADAPAPEEVRGE